MQGRAREFPVTDTGSPHTHPWWINPCSKTHTKILHILGNAGFKLTIYGCAVSVCCLGFASLDVVCDELYDCARNVCLQQLLISVCMFIVSKALFISSLIS